MNQETELPPFFIVRDLTGEAQTCEFSTRESARKWYSHLFEVRPNSRCVIEEVPQEYVWCEHCGYNRKLTYGQARKLDDAKETWCPECSEAIIGHGSEWPDHMHMDWPLLLYQQNVKHMRP